MGDFAVHCCFNLFHQPMVHPCDMLLFAVNKKQKNTPKVPKHSYLIIPALWYIACDSSFIPPQSLTWNLKMMVSNRNLLFQWLIFRFHVKLQGCTLNIISLGRETPRRLPQTCKMLRESWAREPMKWPLMFLAGDEHHPIGSIFGLWKPRFTK